MRNIIKYFIVGLVSVPFFALATPVSWDFTSSVLRPLSTMWTNEVKVPYLTATSTTNNNTLPLLVNTTGTSTNFAVVTRLNLFGTIGTALTDFCVAITGGAGLCDGTDSDTTYTAGDALTLTGNDIDFDGGATPSGDLGGTWASPSVSDDSHAHTGTTISGLDISSDTNLSADGTEIVLTDDALSLGTNLTFTNSTSSNLTVTTGTNLFGGGYVTTANALCQQLTGSAALCDGSDATGGSGSSISTSTTPNIGEVAYWTGVNTLGTVATGTLTTTATGLQLDQTRGLLGGAAVLSLASGYSIPITNTLLATSAVPVTGEVPYWTGFRNLGTIATGTLSESVAGLELSASRYLLGGAAALSLTSGYEIPLTASTTNWNGFYNTPSTRITDGDALTWSSNTLNFDGGASPGGSLGGTWASPTIDDLFLLNTGDVGTGDYDFGGAGFFEIPNGTGPTSNDPGEISHDTTDNQLILDDYVIRTKEELYQFSIGSTSPAFVSGVTKYLPVKEDGYTVTDIYCVVEGGTSKAITIFGEAITCDTDGQADDGTITIATVAAASTTVPVTMGATSGAVNYVNITVTGSYTRE